MADHAELIAKLELELWRELPSDARSLAKHIAIRSVDIILAALTPPTSAEDAAVLMAFQAAAIDAYTQHDGPSELDAKREQLRAAVLARMAGKVPDGYVLVPKQALDALYMRLWKRHEHLDDGPPDFEPVRQPWTPDDDAALKAVAKYLFAAPETPR